MATALLLIDLQNDYFENGKNPLTGALEAGQQARLILEKFRKEKLPVIHIQHLSNRPGATFFIPNTPGAEIHPLVHPLPGEKVMVKHYPNSFRGTDLLITLQELEITHLVVCGMMTHMCVDATVRAAKDLGFELEVIEDACATKNLELNQQGVSASEVHLSFLSALNYFYARITDTQSFLGKSTE